MAFDFDILFVYSTSMPRLSVYKTGYDDGDEYLKQWEFWTDQEKSLAIFNGYKYLHLSSEDVAPYLSTSRMHSITQWLGPLALAGIYQALLKPVFFNSFYRKSPYIGLGAGAAFLGVSTICWLNYSPFYIRKQRSQQKMMARLFDRLGANMVYMNGMINRTRTSTEIDRRTRKLYKARNGNSLEMEEDIAPPIIPKSRENKDSTKVYL